MTELTTSITACRHSRGDADELAMRLACDAPAVNALIQMWADSAVDELEKAARDAVAAFHGWVLRSGHRPVGGGYLVLVLDALFAEMEGSFPEGTPAFDRVLPAFLDARLELLRDWRPRFAHSCGDPLIKGVGDLCDAVREVLRDFSATLKVTDEPAWKAIGVCLLDDTPHLEFVHKVLHERGGLPVLDNGLTHRLWMAMATVYCEWEVSGIVVGLRQPRSGAGV